MELAGLPASGKTTLLRAWCRAFAAKGATLTDLGSSRPAGSPLARAMRRPWTLLRALHLGGLAAGTPGRVRVLLSRLALLERAVQSTADIVLVDEGVLQALWALAMPATQGDAAARAGRLAGELLRGRRHAVVLVTTPPAEIAARLAGRTQRRGRFDALPAGEAAARLAPGPELLERLVEGAGLPCLRVAGGGATTAGQSPGVDGGTVGAAAGTPRLADLEDWLTMLGLQSRPGGWRIAATLDAARP